MDARRKDTAKEYSQDIPPDIDPLAILAAAASSRPHETGITIDSAQTRLIDDGVWVEKNQATGGWTAKTYIVDVPAMIPTNSRFANEVRQKFKGDSEVLSQNRGEMIRNFSTDFLKKFVSLNPGETKPVIGFTMDIAADGKPQSYNIERKVFTSLHKCNLTPLQSQFRNIARVAFDWHRMANQMQAARLSEIAKECDQIVNPNAGNFNYSKGASGGKQKSEFLVQELMRLTNTAASDYLMQHNLTVPIKHLPAYFEAPYVSTDPDFDAECNRVCKNIIDAYSKDRPPKIRLSSPMRIYADYITMQVLVRQLEGKKESPVLKQESLRLSEIFHKAAAAKPAMGILVPWRTQRNAQVAGDHPFNYLTVHHSDAASLTLDNMARQNSWRRTDIAIREIRVPGAYLCVVGMQQTLPRAKPGVQCERVREWAVGLNFEKARELASLRMLESLRNDNKPASTPGRHP